MAANRAKLVPPEMQEDLLRYVMHNSERPLRDRAMYLLSFKAGLRACEMSGLDWADVTDARGKIGQTNEDQTVGFVVPGDVAKKGHERFVPMHDQLRAALEALRAETISRNPALARDQMPVLLSRFDVRMSPNTLQQYMRRVYIAAGFVGCSSHSGRRTLITRALRLANMHNCSIKDVQKIVGHAFIESTEVYIEPSEDVAKLVNAL